MPPTQPLPDTPAPSHLFETHNMEPYTQPTAPQMPSCEICDKPAQLQCGICTEMFFCDSTVCYDACHTRKRDRETHRASVTAYGTSSKCAHHPGQELSLVCEDPACGDALICELCYRCDTHAGHKTVDIKDYMKRQRDVLHSHVADLTAQRTDAEEEVCALNTFVAKAGHMIAECEAVCQLGDDQVLRVVTESQAVVRSINSMAASADRHRLVGAAGPNTTVSLKLPVSNVHDALTAQKSALVVHDAIAALRELGETTLTAERFKQVTDEGSDPKLACLLLQAGAATAIPHNFFKETDVTCIDISYASALVVIGDDFLYECTSLMTVDLSGLQAVILIGDNFLGGCTSLTTVDLGGLQGVRSIRIGFLGGCTSLTTVDLNGLQGVTSIEDGFLSRCTSLTTVDLNGLQGVTSIEDGFLSRCTSLSTVDLSGLQGVRSIRIAFLEGCTSLTTVDLNGLQGVTSIEDGFLQECTSLTTVDLNGLQGVTSIGDRFLEGCTSLTTVDLSALQGVNWIENGFLHECTSLTTVDLSALQCVFSIGKWFLDDCTELKTLHGKDKCSNDVLSSLPDHLRN